MTGIFQVLTCVTLLSTTLAGGPKNGDEGRPYEFGFTIDGQQHRHEKKDERGIVQGEFGFITADGIYHVTVYATDENGRFKILSMRNLRISAPLDGSPFKGEISPEANKYRKQANLPPLPQPNALSVSVVTTPRAIVKFTTQPTIKPACAGCGYVTTKKPSPAQPTFQNFQNPSVNQQPFGAQNNGDAPGVYDNTVPISSLGNVESQGQIGQSQVGFPGGQNVQETPNDVGGSLYAHGSPQISSGAPQYQPAAGPQNTNYNTAFGGSQAAHQGGSQRPAQSAQHGGGSDGQNGQSAQYVGESGDRSQNPVGAGQYTSGGGQSQVGGVGFGGLGGSGPFADGGGGGGSGSSLGGNEFNYQSDQSPGAFGGAGSSDQQSEANPLQIPGQGPPTGISALPPISVSDNVIHVGGDRKQDIPIKDKFPGMQAGLPSGIEENDITELLYKFHYTVGFHGHYEKGLKNGAKIGGYFVNGRDGISRVVTYVADENGYRPKVKFINLGLDSQETPKAETEKTFGLKSFEFVWYPI